ncbi:MAG: S1C family serine protease [Actinomycetota bacterium]|nr:S1C family serine protease [Actinomycetota bacterium]
MWDPTLTTRHRRAGARHADSGPALVPVLVTVLVTFLIGGCSDPPDRNGTSAGSTVTATTDPTSSTPTPSPSTSRPPRTRPPRHVRPPRTRPPRHIRPPLDTVTSATPHQLVGLVRIVASIGNNGQGETSTGMILSSDGKAVTNNHGVAGATAVQATVMSTGRTYTARVVAADPGRDVALLRLDGASRLAGVAFAQRDAAVGDRVTVVGDARGLRFTFTAATGTVLARNQTLVTPATGNTRGERLTGLMLSTCNAVTGESGGPTYDADGRVVGMTTAAVRSSRGLYGVTIPRGALRTIIRDLERRSG